MSALSTTSPQKFTNFAAYCQALKEWMRKESLHSSIHSANSIARFPAECKSSVESNESRHEVEKIRQDCEKLVESEVQQLTKSFLSSQGLSYSETVLPNRTAEVAFVNNSDPDMPVQGRRYHLARPYQRVLAELIDYIILMCIKVFVVFLVYSDYSMGSLLEQVHAMKVRYFSAKSFSRGSSFLSQFNQENTLDEPHSYDDEANLAQAGHRLDLTSLDLITPELLLAEMFNRLLVVLYETMFLYLLGATPGKWLMGIQVVCCHDIFDLPHARVEVLPGTRLNFVTAFLRSFIKNCLLIFFFPFCFITLFFQHYRGSYDLISGTVVVRRPR